MSLEIYDRNVKGHPFVEGSNEPCCDVNPLLWRIFCVFTGRNQDNPSPFWLEQDVINYLVTKGVEYRDAKSASHRS
jgi:hypothetical protein